MKIVCAGGGPAGLYFAISMKMRDPNHDITVVERNRPTDTFGWGVVLSDETVDGLAENDPVTAAQIRKEFAHWDDIDVHFKGEVITSGGHGFCGIGRLRLLNILQDRCRELGVNLVFETEFTIDDIERWMAEADLVVACDGLNSQVRSYYADYFEPDVDVRPNKFVWLGTKKLFNAFTFLFEETEFGWFWVHAYRFEKDTSTFIVECQPEAWEKAGIEHMSKEEGIAFCEKVFAKYLDGHKLISNADHLRGSAVWINFPRVNCGKWHHKNLVLMGDTVHTAHFSIGSGTKLALEDAIHLAEGIHKFGTLEAAFEDYQEARRLECLRLQSAARNSMTWFEQVPRYVHMEPMQFAYSLLTRSQRVSHENLRLRDKAWLEEMERWFASRAFGHEVDKPIPPMFTPFKLRDMELSNRVVVSPMCTYSATDGLVNDFHMVHYGARAQGGASLIFTEMTDISADARISPACAGLYNDQHVAAWKRIVDFVHANTGAKMAIQLGHAGPKGSTKIAWEGIDEPLDEGNWPILSAGTIPYSPKNQTPKAMDAEDMARVSADFVRAAERAEACGFDMIELHCAHGYLLSSFITPLLNNRTDEFGGALENRLRYPLEVFKAVRAVWPEHKPMSVRISATDWLDDGVEPHEAVEIAKAFKQAGVDIINVSAGQTSPKAQPTYGRMFQTPFSDRIRQEARIPTLAVGNIYEIDHVNSIVAAGRADLCCLARPHLADPYWTLHAASRQGYDGVSWPVQYLAGKEQYERVLARELEMAIDV